MFFQQNGGHGRHGGHRRQFFPAFSGIFRGRFFRFREDSFLADFLFVSRRLALLQKLVNPNGFVLLQMCQTGVERKI